MNVAYHLVTGLEGVAVRDQSDALSRIAHVCDVTHVDLEKGSYSVTEGRERTSVPITQQYTFLGVSFDKVTRRPRCWAIHRSDRRMSQVHIVLPDGEKRFTFVKH